jgi:hypothetical protein
VEAVHLGCYPIMVLPLSTTSYQSTYTGGPSASQARAAQPQQNGHALANDIPAVPTTNGEQGNGTGQLQTTQPRSPSNSPDLATEAKLPSSITPIRPSFPGQVNAVPGPSLERLSSSRKRKWDSQGYTADEQAYLERRSNE